MPLPNLLSPKSNSSSIAYKYGLTSSFKQNKSSTSSGGTKFGLNPNLNIQDEYIENLLKQTHFMNMEIKLLKQKQSQSDNNALWGIVNRTNEPLIKNIVDSSEKYQLMKKTMDQQNQRLISDNIRLADEQNAILKEYQYLNSKIDNVKKRKEYLVDKFKEKSFKNTEKVKEYSDRLKIITDQKQNEKKRNIAYLNQLETITTQGQKEQSKARYELNKIKNDQIIEEQMQNQKIQAIEVIREKIKIFKDKFQSNQDYQKAQGQQIALRDRIVSLQKNISGANFDLMQLNESIKMADIEKEKEIKERKNLTQQFESTKSMLMEILFMNLGRKQKQSDNRKRESVQIQKAEYQTKKLQKNLEQIKKKLIKCQDTQNTLRIQVQGLERQLNKLKIKRDQLRTKFQAICAINQSQQKDLFSISSEVRKSQDQYQKCTHQEYILVCQLQQVEKEIEYLRGRKDFLNDTMNLKDTLNETKLEDLQRVVQKNIDLNETVGMLMGKWEQIKTFSRM